MTLTAETAAPEQRTALFAVEGVTVRFGGLVANKDVSLSCAPGRITALMGPNGAGKSTLFDVITGVRRPAAGRVWFDRVDVTGLPAARRAELGIARTFQNLCVVESATTLENVEIGASRFRRYGAGAAALGLRRVKDSDRYLREVAMSALRLLGLAPVAHVRAGSLPYGELRRLEIARALALAPRLLLLDEPSAGMDAAETRELGEALLALQERWEITMLVVEHDLALVRQIAQDAWVLEFGKVVAGGALDEVMAHEDVVAAYLGRGYGR